MIFVQQHVEPVREPVPGDRDVQRKSPQVGISEP